MYDQIRQLRVALAQLSETVDAMERQLSSVPRVCRHSGCVSHVPEGYDTVLGYLAKYQPEVLDMYDYSDPKATQRDGWWLKATTLRMGRVAPLVDAPPVLQRVGITEVRAYPVDVLARRFG
jgi:hypothetical protein